MRDESRLSQVVRCDIDVVTHVEVFTLYYWIDRVNSNNSTGRAAGISPHQSYPYLLSIRKAVIYPSLLCQFQSAEDTGDTHILCTTTTTSTTTTTIATCAPIIRTTSMNTSTPTFFPPATFLLPSSGMMSYFSNLPFYPTIKFSYLYLIAPPPRILTEI